MSKEKNAVDPNYCPNCKKFIVFRDPKEGQTVIGLGEEKTPQEGMIVCSCGFVISDMSDIHPKKPWLKGPRKKPVVQTEVV